MKEDHDLLKDGVGGKYVARHWSEHDIWYVRHVSDNPAIPDEYIWDDYKAGPFFSFEDAQEWMNQQGL